MKMIYWKLLFQDVQSWYLMKTDIVNRAVAKWKNPGIPKTTSWNAANIAVWLKITEVFHANMGLDFNKLPDHLYLLN